jgi:hypothetical protein
VFLPVPPRREPEGNAPEVRPPEVVIDEAGAVPRLYRAPRWWKWAAGFTTFGAMAGTVIAHFVGVMRPQILYSDSLWMGGGVGLVFGSLGWLVASYLYSHRGQQAVTLIPPVNRNSPP